MQIDGGKKKTFPLHEIIRKDAFRLVFRKNIHYNKNKKAGANIIKVDDKELLEITV